MWVGALPHCYLCLLSTTAFAGVGDVIENEMDYVCTTNVVSLPLCCGGG